MQARESQDSHIDCTSQLIPSRPIHSPSHSFLRGRAGTQPRQSRRNQHATLFPTPLRNVTILLSVRPKASNEGSPSEGRTDDDRESGHTTKVSSSSSSSSSLLRPKTKGHKAKPRSRFSADLFAELQISLFFEHCFRRCRRSEGTCNYTMHCV